MKRKGDHRNRPGKPKQSQQQHIVAYEQVFPHPDVLIKYNDAHPQAAEMILDMAKKQQDFALTQLSKKQKHEVIQNYLGQFFAFVIAASLIAAAVYAIKCDSEVAASILGVLGISGIVSIFVKNRSVKKS